MNTQALSTLCAWERKKAIYLMEIAENYLNMDTSGYGELNVNQNSGYTYIWLEDYEFCLFLPIDCDLKIQDVRVMYTDFETGEETDVSLYNFNNLQGIYNWISCIKNNDIIED